MLCLAHETSILSFDSFQAVGGVSSLFEDKRLRYCILSPRSRSPIKIPLSSFYVVTTMILAFKGEMNSVPRILILPCRCANGELHQSPTEPDIVEPKCRAWFTARMATACVQASPDFCNCNTRPTALATLRRTNIVTSRAFGVGGCIACCTPAFAVTPVSSKLGHSRHR